MLCAVGVTLCVSGIVRAVHQSSSKLGDTPLARLDLFESLPGGLASLYNKLYSKIALYIALQRRLSLIHISEPTRRS